MEEQVWKGQGSGKRLRLLKGLTGAEMCDTSKARAADWGSEMGLRKGPQRAEMRTCRVQRGPVLKEK